MKLPLRYRLVGLCVFSTLTIAAFSLKMVWWQLTLPAGQGSGGVPATLMALVTAVMASVGSWNERPWGYILAILLGARENIMAATAFYAQPVGFRVGDVFALALSGIPVAVGMLAAIVLHFNHYTGKEARL